ADSTGPLGQKWGKDTPQLLTEPRTQINPPSKSREASRADLRGDWPAPGAHPADRAAHPLAVGVPRTVPGNVPRPVPPARRRRPLHLDPPDQPLTDAVPDPLHQLALQQPQLRSEEHTSELQSRENLVCRLLLEKKTDC